MAKPKKKRGNIQEVQKAPRKFTKEQIESIRNSPMFVRKRKAAEEAFSSPSYKALSKKLAKKNRKKKKG